MTTQETNQKRTLLQQYIGKQVCVPGALGTGSLTATLTEVEPDPFRVCHVLWSDGDKRTYYLSEVEPAA